MESYSEYTGELEPHRVQDLHRDGRLAGRIPGIGSSFSRLPETAVGAAVPRLSAGGYRGVPGGFLHPQPGGGEPGGGNHRRRQGTGRRGDLSPHHVPVPQHPGDGVPPGRRAVLHHPLSAEQKVPLPGLGQRADRRGNPGHRRGGRPGQGGGDDRPVPCRDRWAPPFCCGAFSRPAPWRREPAAPAPLAAGSRGRRRLPVPGTPSESWRWTAAGPWPRTPGSRDLAWRPRAARRGARRRRPARRGSGGETPATWPDRGRTTSAARGWGPLPSANPPAGPLPCSPRGARAARPGNGLRRLPPPARRSASASGGSPAGLPQGLPGAEAASCSTWVMDLRSRFNIRRPVRIVDLRKSRSPARIAEMQPRRGVPRDVRVLFATRILRLFAYGFLSVVLVLYLAEAGLSERQIGLLLTLTLVGDTLISLWITTTADRIGRRRMLIARRGADGRWPGCSSPSPATSGSCWLAATIGVISPSGNEVGPFLSIEQAALSQLRPDERRTQRLRLVQPGRLVRHRAGRAGRRAALAQALPGAAGSAARQLPGGRPGLRRARALALLLLFTRLSPGRRGRRPQRAPRPPRLVRAPWLGLHRSRKRGLPKLSALFALDAFAGGFVVQSLVAYWFHVRFGVDAGHAGQHLLRRQHPGRHLGALWRRGWRAASG